MDDAPTRNEFTSLFQISKLFSLILTNLIKILLGLHTCDDLPPLKSKSGTECVFDALPGSPNLSNDSHCINWNKYYTNCRAGEKNPFQGAISFDNIGLAWVAIFLVISLEGWTDIMYYVQDAQ
jgi:voltage-dependent calcium channel T type alpha-1G